MHCVKWRLAMRRLLFATVTVLLTSVASSQSADEEISDLSRDELYKIFIIDAGLEDQEQRAAKRYFKFPQDADDGAHYGIDVSHHNGEINWSKIKKQKVKYTYIKMSEGNKWIDQKFDRNMNGARSANIPVGVYHFLSSGVSAESQARHFIAEYKKYRKNGDLPPVLDLEWDPAPRTKSDRWRNLRSVEIANRAKLWLHIVEEELNVKPIIYTNLFWWQDNIGKSGADLARYGVWMSRYGKWNKPSPPVMDSFTWHLWQFTEDGHVDGISGSVDVNKSSSVFTLEQ